MCYSVTSKKQYFKSYKNANWIHRRGITELVLFSEAKKSYLPKKLRQKLQVFGQKTLKNFICRFGFSFPFFQDEHVHVSRYRSPRCTCRWLQLQVDETGEDPAKGKYLKSVKIPLFLNADKHLR